jgi:DNA-binding Lrp family transcriptional regulator
MNDLFDICKGYHKGNPESQAANRSVAKDKQKRRILAALLLWEPATCDRIEVETGLSHQSCSARISELKRDGLIRKVGTAPTRTGCSAAVYKVVT